MVMDTFSDFERVSKKRASEVISSGIIFWRKRTVSESKEVTLYGSIREVRMDVSEVKLFRVWLYWEQREERKSWIVSDDYVEVQDLCFSTEFNFRPFAENNHFMTMINSLP